MCIQPLPSHLDGDCWSRSITGRLVANIAIGCKERYKDNSTRMCNTKRSRESSWGFDSCELQSRGTLLRVISMPEK